VKLYRFRYSVFFRDLLQVFALLLILQQKTKTKTNVTLAICFPVDTGRPNLGPFARMDVQNKVKRRLRKESATIRTARSGSGDFYFTKTINVNIILVLGDRFTQTNTQKHLSDFPPQLDLFNRKMFRGIPTQYPKECAQGEVKYLSLSNNYDHSKQQMCRISCHLKSVIMSEFCRILVNEPSINSIFPL